MEWTQVLTIIGVNIALFGSCITIIFWVVNKLDTDMKAVGAQIDKISSRLDGHAQRIDQLYTTILTILKDKNDHKK